MKPEAKKMNETVEYWIGAGYTQCRTKLEMYVCTLEEFILVDIWIHCCTKLKS